MLWPLRKILPALEMLMRRSGILQLRKDLDFEPKNLDTNLHANNGVEQNPVYILFDLSLQAKATRRGPLPDVTTLLDKAGCPFSKVLRFIAWLFCKRETSYFPRPDHSSNLAWTSNKDDLVIGSRATCTSIKCIHGRWRRERPCGTFLHWFKVSSTQANFFFSSSDFVVYAQFPIQ